MAEKHSESEVDSGASIVDVELLQKEEVQATTRSVKRYSSENIAPPSKSPRTVIPSPETDARPETESQELESENTELQTCSTPPDRRKSWRRATINRRSLPALPNPYQVLCRSISTFLSQNERLEKLMEASMKKAIDRTQSSLQTAAHYSMESFQIKIDEMLKEWDCLARSIQSDSHSNGDATCSDDPSIQKSMEKIKNAISRLEMEKESWETLLNKHRDKAEQLERKVQKGQETGITPDAASLAQSSQYRVIKSKPDYNLFLSRQQPRLQTMALIMDTQCKMVKNLLSIRNQSKLVVTETSGQLAAESGLPELSSDLVKSLITQPLASAMQ
ncbi:kinetochore-associated protein DSN1 homolog [Periophthalmus magnuspinnatus]|uniref:kinetochore-associated protein DSN1 homolog n=1 Tax=Periophthalmus magnuspinnatus TaxID=409849 RepID=UPI002436409D|nr:kinetochore-associated protein DSN1 homolog [Periophthalmus magnuspinnatus]